MSTVWSDLHEDYKTRDWVNKPSIFAETAITYFPRTGKVLDLGAGQGQDSRFFAEHGYDVVSTDLEASALATNKEKTPEKLKQHITLQKVDLRDELPYESGEFDVVYAHLSLHYFDNETTVRLFDEIRRVLRPGGVFAFFVNSIHDPEYNTGEKLEADYFQIDKTKKRYFSVEAARRLTKHFEVSLIDDHGETYKDAEKGVHNLIRYIGTKEQGPVFPTAIPYCGAIIERIHDGEKEVLMQTRWKPARDPVYSGTLEFPAGVLDKPYEDIYDAIAREIKEEAGLTLKTIRDDQRTPTLSTREDDAMIGFRPFCCTQQLKNGKPYIGFIFVCEVEPGEPASQLSESRDCAWMKVNDIKALYVHTPEKLFGLSCRPGTTILKKIKRSLRPPGLKIEDLLALYFYWSDFSLTSSSSGLPRYF